MEIKSVALLGAGAVGSYIIWGLSKLPDIRFGIMKAAVLRVCVTRAAASTT